MVGLLDCDPEEIVVLAFVSILLWRKEKEKTENEK